MQSKRPNIAKQAHGWDPTEYTQGSHKKVEWICDLGHIYSSTINARTSREDKDGCPYCAGKSILKGFNDLASQFPEIAKEADGWDPSEVTVKSGKRLGWICNEGHKWRCAVANRTPPTSSGCPECCEKGFNPGKRAWFYLMERPGEQQFGISNDIKQRLKKHEKNGWILIEYVGPFPGKEVLAAETELKRWLRSEIGVIQGTSENWESHLFQVNSLYELKQKTGIETHIF